MRPLIVKAKFLLPGPSRHQAARDYLKYIANPSRDDLARWEEALRQRNVESEASIYAMHIQERRGSQGLFGPRLNGPVREAELEEVFGDHQGPIWTMIVSVHHDDAVAELPKLMGRAAWEDACQAVMAPLAENMGIPAKDLRWVAAMHRRPQDGSPHVHILFWSDDPIRGVRRRAGQTYHTISPRALDHAKRLWTAEIYGPVREKLGKEKSDLRQDAREMAWQVLGHTQAEELGAQLAAIAASLPGNGRLAYAYMPPEVKVQVDRVTDWLLEQPALSAMTRRYGDIAAELASHYSTDPVRHDLARQNAVADLRRRLAGRVLRRAAGFDQGLAWRAVTSDIWASARGKGEAARDLTTAIQAAVHLVAIGRVAPREAARSLLAAPEMAAHMADLRRAAERRGDPSRAAQRVAQLQRRLETVMAVRLSRGASYLRSARGYRADRLIATWSAAMSATLRKMAREAEQAARQAELEAEAQQSVVTHGN